MMLYLAWVVAAAEQINPEESVHGGTQAREPWEDTLGKDNTLSCAAARPSPLAPICPKALAGASTQVALKPPPL